MSLILPRSQDMPIAIITCLIALRSPAARDRLSTSGWRNGPAASLDRAPSRARGMTPRMELSSTLSNMSLNSDPAAADAAHRTSVLYLYLIYAIVDSWAARHALPTRRQIRRTPMKQAVESSDPVTVGPRLHRLPSDRTEWPAEARQAFLEVLGELDRWCRQHHWPSTGNGWVAEQAVRQCW